MARNPMQKQKLLCLQKILLEKTDENNALTINQLIKELDAYGISAERKSLYDDLKVLENFGLDVCRTKTTTTKYYVGSRDFEIAELKLLVDAIQSSKFITQKKSLSLIKKIEGLVSVNEGKQLQRQVFVANRVKTLNEKIYYNVDTLHNAISAEKQITFKYYQWEVNFGSEQKIRKSERKNGMVYKVSPWALCWDDENYYLIAYDKSADMIKHYRVDKMGFIEITDEERDGRKLFEKFDIAGYSKSVFAMFGGEQQDVRLSVKNELVGVIVDRFGPDVFITKETDKTFCVSVKVVLSQQFYGWVFGLGSGIKILSPQKAVDEYINALDDIAKAYL